MAKRGAAKGAAAKRLKGPGRNLVDTPPEAVEPLLAVLPQGWRYIEPCAGAGGLRGALGEGGMVCMGAFDIAPRSADVAKGDARLLDPDWPTVTNPPYDAGLALPIMQAALGWRVESWWLCPLDWLANAWFAPVAPHVATIVPVGRVSWIRTADGGPTGPGFENSAWLRLTPAPQGFLVPRARKRARRRAAPAAAEPDWSAVDPLA